MNVKSNSTYYTAVGHFRRKTDNNGRSCPVILVNREEHIVDIQVMALSRQALLSTAELIKCAEVGATSIFTEEKLLDALIDNDYTTSDSIAFEMLQVEQRAPVTMAVANLYLRKQIVFERI